LNCQSNLGASQAPY
jgi:hypothetical protein